MKADQKWTKKKNKITAQAKKASQRELDNYGNELLKLPGAFKTNGKLSAQTINTYNRKMAEVMSQQSFLTHHFRHLVELYPSLRNDEK